MGMTPEQREVYDLRLAGYTSREIAEQTGRTYKSVKSLWERAQKWANAPEGQRAAVTHAGLDMDTARAGWRIIQHDDGSRDSVYWRAPDLPDDTLDRIREAFTDIPAAPYIARPEAVKARSVAFLPHSDWHLGSVVSADHVGQDYNRDIAVERLKDGFSQCLGAIPPSEVAIILNNGDLTHTNSDRDVTDRSNHKLKVEGTHHDNLRLAIHSTVWMIDCAREIHDQVIYTARPGNHDGMTPTVLTAALEQRYRDDPRVNIETDQRETWVWQRDRLFLSAHHGHGLKPEKFCANIPARFKREFGVSDYWYFFTGHLHNREERTYGGIVHKQLPAICSIDGYGDGMGFADTAGMSAMRFDTLEGLKNEHVVNL